MEQSEKNDATPRRSTRLLQRQRALTPDVEVLGPRELAKLNRSRQKNNQNTSTTATNKTLPPQISITPATPLREISKKKRNTSVVPSTVEPLKNDSEAHDVIKSNAEKQQQAADMIVVKTVVKETIKDNKQEKAVEDVKSETGKKLKEHEPEISSSGDTFTKEDELESVPKAEQKSEATSSGDTFTKEDKLESVPKVEQKSEATSSGDTFTKEDELESVSKVEQKPEATSSGDTITEEKKTEMLMDMTEKLLMDESIISIPESPVLSTTPAPIKDSTFSPEVDTSIQDSRPHIDKLSNITPLIPKHVTLRTSTPLSQRILIRETPKLSLPVVDALKKMFSPQNTETNNNKKPTDESLSETLNGLIKAQNPLEKSILKSSRRKRSLSVADGEPFMQKRVMFVSPQIMNIDTIDEKMFQSFREEKENSIIKQNLASGGTRRKRSMSESGTPAKAKARVPNFKAIHEQQLRKMESIQEYQKRKEERAKRLLTPSKNATEKSSHKEVASKIPTRQPLKKVSSSENLIKTTRPRMGKRSNSENDQSKPTSSIEKKIVLPRILDENLKAQKISKIPNIVASKNVNINFHAQTSGTATTAKLSTQSSKESTAAAMRSKVEERREKNISMYKGNAVRAGLDHRKKNENALKGVRLNRRFELQMQHRRIGESKD